MIQLTQKYPKITILIVALFVFMLHLDVLYANIMEARNFVTAREMLSDGNWLLTTMDGLPRYEKPPLPTWFAAIFGSVFGIENIAALRFPSALITVVLLFFMYTLSRKLTNHKLQSLITALILATSFYIIFAGRNGTWDIFAHSFMLGGIYYLYQFFETEKQIYKNAIFAGVFVGLSFMSKGPVSHFALLLPFLIAYGVIYRFKGFKSRWLPLVLLLFITIVLSGWWAYYIYLLDSDDATRIALKETDSWKHRNVKPFYYYWSFFTQSGLWTIPAFISLLYPYLKSKVSNLKAYQFAIIWTFASVILLSFIPEKKSRYLLPVLIPLAFTISFYINYLFNHFKSLKSRWETVPVYFNFGLIGVIGISFPIVGYIFLKERLDGYYLYFICTSISLVLIGGYIIKSLIKKEISRVFFSSIFFIMAIITFGFPLANTFLDNPTRKSLTLIEEEEQITGRKVYNLNGLAPELIWDYGKTTTHIKLPGGKTKLPTEKSFGVLTRFNDLGHLKSTFPNHEIIFKDRYDYNVADSTKRGNKSRLKADYYWLDKKE